MNGFLRTTLRLASLFCILVLFSAAAFAQTETGQITGTITDATGAVVVGAKVVAKSVNTGLTRETSTNSAGIYTIPSLRPDAYDVAITAVGFQSLTQRVVVAVGGKSDVSAQLAVGSASETVEVTGSAENAVNTENQTLSETINSQQIE